MVKIHQRYIDNAIRIRKEFLTVMRDILDKETEIKNYKNRIDELMSINKKYINDNSKSPIQKIKKDISDDLNDIESNIILINNKLLPILEKLEKLKKDSKELYSAIRDKYPNLSEQDIQNQIFEKLPE
jgi:DNA repair ATPase RecN